MTDNKTTLGNAKAYSGHTSSIAHSITEPQRTVNKGNSKAKAYKEAKPVNASLQPVSEWPSEKPRSKMGRPTMYSEEMRDKICIQLANGITMAKICQQEGMPSFDTVWKWTTRHPDFAESTARAREIGTHYLADDCIAIADNPELDPADKRIMIDTRVRLIGKWNQYYSDKAKVEISGKVDVSPVNVGQLDYDQREALAGMLEQIALPSPDADDGDL